MYQVTLLWQHDPVYVKLVSDVGGKCIFCSVPQNLHHVIISESDVWQPEEILNMPVSVNQTYSLSSAPDVSTKVDQTYIPHDRNNHVPNYSLHVNQYTWNDP